MPTSLRANTPLMLTLEFEGAAKFTVVDFRRKSSSAPWSHTVVEQTRVVAIGDPPPYTLNALSVGEQAVVIVAANATTGSGTGRVKLAGDLADGASNDAESDSGAVPSGGYVSLNLRFDVIGS